MYSRLRFIWIVECRTSSIIWIASPLWTSGLGTALIASGIARAAEISGNGMMLRKTLLPLHPPLLDLAEHVAADRAAHRAEDAVVLLLLHPEVGAQDLLERVLPRGLLERVVGRVVVDRLDERRLPGQLLDLLVGLRDACSAQGRHLLSLCATALTLGGLRAHAALTARVVPSGDARRAAAAGSRTPRVSADGWKRPPAAGTDGSRDAISGVRT